MRAGDVRRTSWRNALHESRFTHSGLAGDAHKLPFPFESRRKRLLQTLHLLIALEQHGSVRCDLR